MLENLLDALCTSARANDRIVVAGVPTREPSRQWRSLCWIPPPRGRNRFIQSWRFGSVQSALNDALLFPNYFTPPMWQRRARIVTVIHDLQYRVLPATFSRVKRLWLRVCHDQTLRHADRVVTISEHVRAHVLEAHGDRWSDKVIAIPNPMSWERFGEGGGSVAGIVEPTRRYILAVSAQYAHKNLGTLIDAFAELRKRPAFADVVLVLVGQWSSKLVGIAHAVDLRGRVEQLGLGDAVRMTGFIDDLTLGSLYRRASVFVFPSLFEGFGMPAVEALGFGLPVLTTRRTAIPEATLGLATYLDDALDSAAMAEAIAAMLDRPDAFRPSASDVARVRDTYSIARIGELYRTALLA